MGKLDDDGGGSGRSEDGTGWRRSICPGRIREEGGI